MWTSKDVYQTTTDVVELIKAKFRPSVFGEILVTSLRSKVEKLQPPFSPRQAIMLPAKARLLPEGCNVDVMSAVWQRLTSTSPPQQENPCKTLSLSCARHYLTEKEWVAFESLETNFHPQRSILSWRLKSLGFVCVAGWFW